jgi:hypothetical protein
MGLSLAFSGTIFAQIIPNEALIVTGGPGNPADDEYHGIFSSGPSVFGSGNFKTATSSSGEVAGVFGLDLTLAEIFVPGGYVSDTALSDTATYASATFARLGHTPGTYTWTWGSGADECRKISSLGGVNLFAGRTFD